MQHVVKGFEVLDPGDEQPREEIMSSDMKVDVADCTDADLDGFFEGFNIEDRHLDEF